MHISCQLHSAAWLEKKVSVGGTSGLRDGWRHARKPTRERRYAADAPLLIFVRAFGKFIAFDLPH